MPGTSTTEDEGSTGADGTSDDHESPADVWARGDRPNRNHKADAGVVPFDDLHFHRYCDLVPVRLTEEARTDDAGFWGRLSSLPDGVEFFPTPDGVDEADRTIHYLPSRDRREPETTEEEREAERLPLTGLVRTALQYTPLMVTCIALLFVVSAELVPHVQGLSVYLSSLPLVLVPAGAGGAVLWGLLAYLVVGAGLVEGRELAKAVAVYGLAAVLALGTAASIFFVLTAEDPRTLEPNIVYTSGYLMLILVGGVLTYDAMLRTEHLFEHLGDKLVVEGPDETAYPAYRRKVADQLSHRTTFPGGYEVPTYLLFAPLLVAQFAAVWALAGDGPQNLSFSVTFGVNVLLDLVLAVIYFQLFVLIKSFHDLVTGTVTLYRDEEGYHHEQSDAGDRTAEEVDLLSYRPFHPDGRGGFRDFGKFATRVNVLLILGGLYVTYRLYVQGARDLPAAEVALDTALSLDVFVWVVSYVGPVVVLIVVAFAWLYYSFWTLHVKMAHERERAYVQWTRRRRDDESDDLPRDTPLGAVEDAADWQERRAPAPVWPVDSRLLASLVSSSLAPLLLALPQFLL
ncbi:hypothetical protein N0B31_03790 [Salinirubellus salinus]|uniref:Uncharacterized protein n=1 Tax=Salinirubellus salinus TaxID=1364945 RepID=A0A9E7U5I1_9EURY|nr:hypothetical protein [Salinirubellus salinus]UWM55410.1 hypothetical protein N0B31_03790 [Salinirubellus salinus]